MVNIGPQYRNIDLNAMFIADVSQPRRQAKVLAGELLRAAAHAIQGGSREFSFRVPADPAIAGVQAASLIRLAQEIHPITVRPDPKWERPEPRPGRGVKPSDANQQPKESRKRS